jgi:hypothetical protein
MRMLRPSVYPSSRRLWRNPAHVAPGTLLSTPIRGTLPGCPSAASGAARKPPAKVPMNARRSITGSPESRRHPTGHFSPPTPEPPPKPAEQPSHQRLVAGRSWNMTASRVRFSRASRHRSRRPPDQHPFRLVRGVGVADPTVAGMAGAVLPETPNEHRQVRQMSGRNLGGGGQMFQAIRLDDPGRVIAEDLSNPNLLSTGEHGRLA